MQDMLDSREKTPLVNISLTTWILKFPVDLKQQHTGISLNITHITILIKIFLPVSSQQTELLIESDIRSIVLQYLHVYTHVFV